MNLDWQLIIVAACVLWAVFVLCQRVIRVLTPSMSLGCGTGGCHSCPSAKADKQPDLVQLQLPAGRQSH